MTDPLLLYVPGLMPKPAAAWHKEALARSLAAGLKAIGADTAPAGEAFAIYAWTHAFYDEHRDFALDAAAVDRLVAAPAASDRASREARSLARRAKRALFRIGNAVPILIPCFANDQQRLHLRDFNRYARDDDGAATRIRQGLAALLREARDRPILLLGHSMGSVICWDTLWHLHNAQRIDVAVDLFLTMGSPLGQRYVQARLLFAKARDKGCMTPGIRRWVNLAAAGDLTSLDQRLADDFAPRFPGSDLAIEDAGVSNAFRLDGVLEPHAEYGYLANPVTARIVADCWSACSAGATRGSMTIASK